MLINFKYLKFNNTLNLNSKVIKKLFLLKRGNSENRQEYSERLESGKAVINVVVLMVQ
jgi:hypothetical protein